MMPDLIAAKKTVAVVDCMYLPFKPSDSCLGGSETWIVEIAKAFAGFGWHVVVFANTGNPVITGSIEWFPFEHLRRRCEYQVFDIAIFSRGFIFSNIIRATRNYLMFHDLALARAVDPVDRSNFNRIDRLYVLSDYAKDFIRTHVVSAPEDRFFLTHNGIDYNLYSRSVNKQPAMVWSSCRERGFGFFVAQVLPTILAAVPEFVLHVCSYNDYGPQAYIDIPAELKKHMVFHGKLGKQELAALQCGTKVWCYPNLGYLDVAPDCEFGETFCITAVENLAAGNIIIAGDFGGLQTTLQGYPLLGRDYYLNRRIPAEKLEDYGRYLADYCIAALRDEYTPLHCIPPHKYTWEAAAMTFIN